MFNKNQDQKTNRKTYFIVLGIALAMLFGVSFAIVHSNAQDYEEQMNYQKEVLDAYEKRQQESYEAYSIWVKYHPEYDSMATDTEATRTAETTTEETTTEKETITPKALALENKEFIAESVTEGTTEAEIEPEATETIEERTEKNEYAEDDEIDLLCRVVNAENGSAPDWVVRYTTQVILNRVNSSEFPNTIRGVITQTDPIQYSTYWNGDADQPASERVISLVLDVMENGCDLPGYVIGQSMNTWNGCVVHCQYDSPDGPEYFFWWED